MDSQSCFEAGKKGHGKDGTPQKLQVYRIATTGQGGWSMVEIEVLDESSLFRNIYGARQ